MASFLNRTTGGKGKVGEKNNGEVKFLGGDGKEKTAKVMFLSGTVVEEPQPVDDKQKKAKFSRREQLVKVALEEKTFFSRAIVNRMWAALFGRGLVDPVDQMHSENPPSIPGVLDFLAEDFIENGYDLKRLVTIIARTEAYQLGSRWPHESDPPGAEHFAVAALRPLSQKQLAFSLLLATGDGSFGQADATEKRVAAYLDVDGLARIADYVALEERAAELLPALDAPSRGFQSSAAEALFFSNDERIQRLVAAEGNNLSARLTGIKDTKTLIATAVKTVLSRPPTDAEIAELGKFFENAGQDRKARCEQLVWALLGSAEFRFNH
jgi:hypothetical protein